MTQPSLRLYDTLTSQLQPVVPRHAGEARIYCCGPTVYDDAHVGHARAALAPDVLVRHLRSQGLRVTYVRNLTDVDDKILNRAAEAGEEPPVLATRMAARYQEDIGALGCVPPDIEPKVSGHIPQIITMIERIVSNGAGYVVELENGTKDVYYAVRSFARYGQLSGRRIDDMRVGARIEPSERKHDPLDFALWKGCDEKAWGWPSPWGRGRPGWHIECSAMSTEYLGHGFDVHCGGMDLIFPHHENEIAQAEAARPDEGPFVQMWMHNGFVNVDKEKMAKSLGNFVTIRDVYQRYDPEALRYFLLGVHYRGPIAFDTEKLEDGRVVFPGVAEAERRIDYLYAILERLGELAREADGAGDEVPKELAATAKLVGEAPARLTAALDDDLNSTVGLAVVGELAKQANELCDLALKRRKDARFRQAASRLATRALATLRQLLEVLGLCRAEPEAFRARTQARRLGLLGIEPAAIERLITERRDARAAKDFERADRVRQELTALGIEIADSATGTTWRVGVR